MPIKNQLDGDIISVLFNKLEIYGNNDITNTPFHTYAINIKNTINESQQHYLYDSGFFKLPYIMTSTLSHRIEIKSWSSQFDATNVHQFTVPAFMINILNMINPEDISNISLKVVSQSLQYNHFHKMWKFNENVRTHNNNTTYDPSIIPSIIQANICTNIKLNIPGI